MTDRRAYADHDGHVYRGDERGQSTEHHGLVDDHVDVVEAVLQDGDADGQRDEDERTRKDGVLEVVTEILRADQRRHYRTCDRGHHEQGGGVDEPLDLLALGPPGAPETNHDGDQGKQAGDRDQAEGALQSLEHVADRPADREGVADVGPADELGPEPLFGWWHLAGARDPS